MPNDIQVELQGSRANGRYVARVAGREGAAEMTFHEVEPGLVSADHTYAPPQMRGSGAAQALLARLIADARAEGFRIRPACSYVADAFARHPEWADLAE